MTRDTKFDHRAPQAFKLEPEATTKKARSVKVMFEAEPPAQELAMIPVSAEIALPTGPRWGLVLISALATLFALWLGLTATQIVEGFFARSAFMGWLALGVAGIAGFAAVAMILREIWGLFRLRRIEQLQLAASHALNHDDAASAKLAVSELTKLFSNRPDSAWNLKNLSLHGDDIMDPRDRVRLAERYLVEPLDEVAHRIIAKRARRVTLLTTVTPAAALDSFVRWPATPAGCRRL